MELQKHFECDTPDCIHWKHGECAKAPLVTIQEHHCIDFEERLVLPEGTVTIEVSGGVVQNVYASPDLPAISVELIDFDNLREGSAEEQGRSGRLLKLVSESHTHIF